MIEDDRNFAEHPARTPRESARVVSVVPSEAAAAPGAAAVPNTSLATLLASHILRDGEVVILILKPSFWFIALSSLRFIAITLILMIAAKIFDPQLPGPYRSYLEAGISVITGRLMWASLQWMSRIYVLTDLRVLSLHGVITIDVFDCPLRKLARTRVVRNMTERLLNVGSIEIIPQDESAAFGLWQTVAKPNWVREQIIVAMKRAKQGPTFGC